jgi:hypothetical protein
MTCWPNAKRNTAMLDENGSQLKEGDERDAQEFNIRILHQVYWTQRAIAQALGVSLHRVHKTIRERKMAEAA